MAESTDPTSEVVSFLNEYYRAFSRAGRELDVPAILPYFLEPSLLIGPLVAAAAPTHVELGAILKPPLENLRAGGYHRSELTSLQLKPLSASTVLANGVAIRYKADGQELNRAGVLYVLQRAGGGWKIAVLVTHDSDKAPRLA